MSEKPTIKAKLLRYPPQIAERVQKLKDHFSYPTDSVVFIHAINDLYTKTLDNYVAVAKEKIRTKPSVVDKEKAKLEASEIREKAKKQKLIDEKMAICDELGGTAEEVKPGIWVCTYKKFNEEAGKKVSEFISTVPFDQLTPDLSDYQYTDIVGYQGKKAKEKILSLMGLK